MYIHTYFNTYQKIYKKKREGGLGGTKNSWYKWVTKTIMTQTQDHEHRHSSFSYPLVPVKFRGWTPLCTHTQTFFSVSFSHLHIYISMYVYTYILQYLSKNL